MFPIKVKPGLRAGNLPVKDTSRNNIYRSSHVVPPRMRRAKLAPGALSPGSLPPTSWYEIPRCFVCDETIKSHRLSTSLLAGRTQHSNSPLPSKIGEYIGDEFVVVVTAQDALCKQCMALINTMDRLEQELHQHRLTLTQHLKIKYRLGGETGKQICKEEVGEEEDDDEPEVIEVADEEWTPNKKMRTDSSKQHRCTICNATYTNLSVFMAHLGRHKQLGKSKPRPVPVKLSTLSSTMSGSTSEPLGDLNHAGSSSNQLPVTLFKCGCCTKSFVSKEKLAEHMRMHTSQQTPCLQSQTVVEMKLLMDSEVNTNQPYDEHVSEGTSTSLFQDLDQLPPPEIPEVPEVPGVCSEEQKGRVCLLALLNNGVCSDMSHREPVSNPNEAAIASTVSNMRQDTTSISEEPTVSLPVSTSSDLCSTDSVPGSRPSLSCNSPSQSSEGLQTNHHTSSAVATDVSETVCVLSDSSSASSMCAPSVHAKSPGSTHVSLQHETRRQDRLENALDLPDLIANTLQDVSSFKNEMLNVKMKGSEAGVTKKDATSCGRGRTNVLDVLITASGASQDLPNLLDDKFLSASNDTKNIEHAEKQRDSGELPNFFAIETDNSAVQSIVFRDAGNLKSRGAETTVISNESIKSETGVQRNASKNDQDSQDSIGNIAIVSVTSVHTNSENSDPESIAAEWFYSDLVKESMQQQSCIKSKDTSTCSVLPETWPLDGNTNSPHTDTT